MGLLGCAEDAPVKRKEWGIRLSPKSGEVHGLEMFAYMVDQGSERSVHVLGGAQPSGPIESPHGGTVPGEGRGTGQIPPRPG